MTNDSTILPAGDHLADEITEAIRDGIRIAITWPYPSEILGVIYNAVRDSMPTKDAILDAIAHATTLTARNSR